MKPHLIFLLIFYGAPLCAQIEPAPASGISYVIKATAPMYDSQGKLLRYLYTGQILELIEVSLDGYVQVRVVVGEAYVGFVAVKFIQPLDNTDNEEFDLAESMDSTSKYSSPTSRAFTSESDILPVDILDRFERLVPPTQGMNLVNPITGQPTRKLAASANQDNGPEFLKAFDKYALSNNPLRSLIEASPQTFKPSEVNYDRFNNSPAKEKLGYYPYKVGTDGYNDQLKRYQRYEMNHINKKYVLPIFIGLAVFFLFLYRKAILLAIKSRVKENLYEESNSLKNYVTISPEKLVSSIEELKEEIETLKILKNEGIIDEDEYIERKNRLRQKY